MKIVVRILIPAWLLSSGCSAMITATGTDVEALQNREGIRAKFGEPVNSGIEDGEAFDEFATHRKVSNPVKAHGYLLASGMTFGLGEVILFPYTLVKTSSQLIRGQTVRVTYDSKGNIESCKIDGDSAFLYSKRHLMSETEQEKKKE